MKLPTAIHRNYSQNVNRYLQYIAKKYSRDRGELTVMITLKQEGNKETLQARFKLTLHGLTPQLDSVIHFCLDFFILSYELETYLYEVSHKIHDCIVCSVFKTCCLGNSKQTQMS